MDPDSVELFYENLGFELATIDDMDTLFLTATMLPLLITMAISLKA